MMTDAATRVTDPVCGMKVDPATAAGRSEHAGVTYYFCSGHCKQSFDRDPAKYAGTGVGPAAPLDRHHAGPEATHAHHHDEPEATHAHPHGVAPAPPEGTNYTCPMHPEIIRDRPGSCPICGMALEPVTATGDDANPELAEMGRRFWASLALTVPLLALAMGEMVPALRGIVPPRAATWIQLALATPVVVWGGWPFFARGWASLVRRSLNMFTLIALGTGAAYAYSLIATLLPGLIPASFRTHGGVVPVYFEAAAVITTLVLLGQVLELRARSQTSGAIKALLGLAPKAARRLREDGSEEDVPLDASAGRRSAPGPPGGESARRRRGRRGPQHGRRVDDHRRADPGREGAGGPRHRRHGQRDGQPGHAGRARWARRRCSPRSCGWWARRSAAGRRSSAWPTWSPPTLCRP